VLLIVALAILCGVVVVAMGRGGELARQSADVRPLDGEIITAADVALLRPPAALWGYDMRSTDDALNMVARTVTERDVEIAILRRQIADLEAAASEPGIPAKAPRPIQAPPPAQARPPVKGVSGPLPSPFSRGAGGTRPAGEPPSWSAWQRPTASPSPPPSPDASPSRDQSPSRDASPPPGASPAPAPPAEQEPGEQRERERGTG
jgi:hypothetical protein